MTSVVGLDVGNMASKIGLARKRGIDIIANEVSNRATPSLVAFGPRNRSIGESAKTQETSNFRNTVGSLKRLIGRSVTDPDVAEIESKFLNAELVDAQGTVGVKVNYLGEEQVLSATQLYAALLGRLRDTAQAELKANVNDVVIAVPGWYTDAQRRAVLDAAEIANLHPLRLINELTATALGYGITKTDLPSPEEKPRYVAFVDIGHSQYQVAIVAFSKGALHVKGFAYDHHFGGRDLDYALLKHFAGEFKEKYKIDVLSNKKAIFRLAAAVEKLKKVLSANAQAPLNVESLMNDIDASSSYTREAFEELISPLLERTIAPLERALAQADISKDDIETVELIGGSTRVPALKSRVQEFFGKPLSFTCNQDEAVARGATLACAGLSPIFKVREFAVNDIANFAISTAWQPTPDDPNTSLETFIPESHVPSGKQLTFYRSEPFELEVRYSEPQKLPGSINPFIARYVVRNVAPDAKGQPASVKIKAKLNISGLVSLEGAVALEEVQAEAPPAEGGEEAKPAKKTIKKELSASFMTSSLERPALDDLLAKEGDMHAGDKLVSETEDRKNALEEYVYDTREKLEGAYAPFVTAEVKEQLLNALQQAEDWLYSEEGEDASKSQYVARLDELTAIGNPIKFRQREAEERPRAERQLREMISEYMQKAQCGDPMYAHISEKDIQTAIEKCAAADKWIGDVSAKQAELSKTQEPAMSSSEILKRKDNLMFECNSIFNKPPPKTTANPDANKNANQNQQNENAQPANEQPQTEPAGGEETEGEKPAPGAMDVD
ncbi:adenyl-nucleotide exchange factor sse1 [Puccinia graminis f. sp. tritici]|uniref:Heat shock 70kDa protein 4 n=2 Tax=Puccinia graminis f. sp. tritici TaxID=56615 RepID=E3K5H8_PUCGT|nr:heat shock 70kDa protein 4 [Puccinia graminis f. sp. tritici CRL 75-36-700-3]EFP79754.1 heat shock 70kDa protein 4 [Puccinia graminis f. sp. tritici CRL 75-36-700-3]KAA1109742.1 adenyl-nucleotide exchange factor sse1 [Puccinia graminis f. sp. tritici]KAA1119666.1 adenyl-nucleotide exchange factor sse1 [Puccinia graminis f. sp. tritici]